MTNTLIAYSTTDGHTRRIGERLQEVLEQCGHRVTLLSLERNPNLQLAIFDVIVVGASVRYGRHRPPVYAFIRRHAAVLNDKPAAFFSVNLLARKPEKRRPETNPYVKKFLKQIPWRPRAVAVFGGKLNYPAYGVLDRLMIRLIMKITGGPTDPATVEAFTDWDAVDAFGRQVAAFSGQAMPGDNNQTD